MPKAVIIALAVFGVMALVAVLVAIISAVTTSSYDKSLTGNPGDEN